MSTSSLSITSRISLAILTSVRSSGLPMSVSSWVWPMLFAPAISSDAIPGLAVAIRSRSLSPTRRLTTCWAWLSVFILPPMLIPYFLGGGVEFILPVAHFLQTPLLDPHVQPWRLFLRALKSGASISFRFPPIRAIIFCFKERGFICPVLSTSDSLTGWYSSKSSLEPIQMPFLSPQAKRLSQAIGFWIKVSNFCNCEASKRCTTSERFLRNWFWMDSGELDLSMPKKIDGFIRL